MGGYVPVYRLLTGWPIQACRRNRQGGQITSDPQTSRDASKFVNFANRVKEAGRRSDNAQDMTVWGETSD
jgi:hypothetical protein